MMRTVTCLFLILYTNIALAASEPALYSVKVDVRDQASLQRGAGLFMNYCMGCHSVQYMRYERMALDLGIPEEILRNNLMLGTDRPGDTMEIAMQREQAQAWFFGAPPPDLTLTARARGADWLYSYLMTFYVDPDQPTGFNNLQSRGIAMPHVLWELQGLKQVVRPDDGSNGPVELETMVAGELSDADYARAMRDLVNFMVYISEPARLQRITTGVWVMIYLFLLLIVVYLLKKEYWKDVR